MAQSDKKVEIAVGFFILLGLIVLGGLIINFGKINGNRGDSYEISVVFKDASGLIKGSQVNMGGTNIGEVTRTPYLDEQLRAVVDLAIDSDTQIPSGSEFNISSVGILGDRMVQIVRPDGEINGFIQAKDRVMGMSPASIESLASNIPSITKEALVLIRNLNTTVTKLDTTLDQISTSANSINKGILSGENQKRISGIITNLEALSLDLAEAGKEIKPTVSESRTAIAKISQVADSANKTFVSANEQITLLKPSLEKIPTAIDALANASSEAEKAIADIRNGKGLISTLTQDKAIAQDVKTLIKNLKRHGVLGYRDDEEEEPKPDPRETRYVGDRR